MAFSANNGFSSLVGKKAIGYGTPTAPTGLTLISSTSSSVTISFTAPTNYGTLTYTSNIGSGSGTPSSYTITGLSGGSNTITLTARNIYGTSVQSVSFIANISSTSTYLTSMPYFFTSQPYAIATIAGTGTTASATTNSAVGSAVSATLNKPSGVTADTNGNYYITDFVANQLIKVDNNGTITVLLSSISGNFYVVIDPANYNNLYITNGANSVLYKYVINTATLTTYYTPSGFTFTTQPAIDTSGNIYFGASTAAVYKITTSSTTPVAITAPTAYGAWTAGTVGTIVDKSNNLYVYDWTKLTILKLNVVTNTWSLFFNLNTAAGTYFQTFQGGGFDNYGNLYLMVILTATGTTYSCSVIKVTSQTSWSFIGGNYGSTYYALNTQSYTAGTWTLEHTLAGNTAFPYINSMCVDPNNNIIIPDRMNSRVRKIYTATPGRIYTIAGNLNSNATSGDGSFANLASLSTCRWIFVDKYFNIYVSSDVAARLRRIDGTSGIITTIAGTGTNGNTTTSNATASSSAIGTAIGGCVVDTSMNVYFADYTNKVVRKIDQFGTMNTIGGPYTPNIYAMAVDQSNNIYWAPNAGATGTVFFYQYSPLAVTTTYTLASGYNFQSNGVFGMAVDKSQNVYLSDTATATSATTRILKYNMGTNTTSVLTSSLGSYCIWQMVYNASNNSLYCGTNSTGTGGGICYISCSTGAITPICTSANTVYSNIYGRYNEILSTNYATNYMTGMAIDSIGNIYTCGGVAGTGTNASRIDVIPISSTTTLANEVVPIPPTIQFDASTLSSGDNILMRNTATVTTNFVQSWNDATNTYTATQATTANQPSYTFNGMNSMDVITFTGATGQILTTGTMPANTTNQMTLFFVFNMSSFSKFINQLFSSDSGWSSGVIQVSLGSGGAIQVSLNSTNVTNYTLTISANTNYILMVNYSAVSGSYQSYARLNGVAGDIFTHGGTQALVCSGNWNIGNWAGDTTRTMTGRMAEMLVYYRDLSTTEIQTVEQYLSRKWKIAVTKPYYFDYGSQIANITNIGNNATETASLSTGSYCLGTGGMSYSGQFAILLGPGTTGTLYTTANYGNTWTARTKPTASNIYYTIGMSGTGQYCVLPSYGSGIYYSSDYGVSWAQSNASTSINWANPASSGSGQYWICSTGNSRSGIYYSSDYGKTWALSTCTNATITTSRWDAVAMSETGQYAIASAGGNLSAIDAFLYSSNYGATWTRSATTATPSFYACMSSSGQYCYIVGNNLWYSSNYGVTYTQATYSQIYGYGIACSYDGKYVVVGSSPWATSSGIWISSNYGNTYTKSPYQSTNTSGVQLMMSRDLRYYIYWDATTTRIMYGSNPIRSAPAAPTGLTYVRNTTTSITFSFTPSAGEVFSNVNPIQNSVTYTAYVNGTATTSAFGIPSSFTITGLTIGTNYSITLTATTAGGTSGQSTALAVSTTLPLIWFKMNPGDITGTTLTNYGSAGNATITGSPAISNFTTGSNYGYNNGYALYMGASNYINLPAINFNVSGRFTISMWINITSGTTTAFPYFAFNNVAGYAAAFVFSYNPNGNPYNPYLYLPNCPLGATNYLTQIGASLSDGNFHHLVVVFGGTSSGSLNVYLDNFQIKAYQSQTAYSNLTCPFTLSCTSAYSTIGYANWSTGQSIIGYVGDFRLYNTGFTATDVNNLYTTMSGNAPTNVYFVSATSTSITVTFTAPSGTVSSYTPYVNGAEGTGSGTAAAYTITGLTANTTYTIYMVATLSAGASKPSNTINAQTVVNTSDFGVKTWFTSNIASSIYFNSVRLSYTGQYGIGGAPSPNGSYGVYYTNNFGATWTISNIGNSYGAIYATAISGTGQYAVAGTYGGLTGMYYSSNYGQTFTQSNITTNNWYSLAMSYDGKYAIAAAGFNNLGIYYSSNYGKTWTVSNVSSGFNSNGVSMSYSGQYCIAPDTTGGTGKTIRYSSNYGQTWSASPTTSNTIYSYSSISPDGKYAIDAAQYGTLYSSNSGQTWTSANSIANGTGYGGVALITNGLALWAGTGSYIQYSTNYGQTWSSTTLAGSAQDVAISGNGQVLLGALNPSGSPRYSISSVPGAPTYLQLVNVTSTTVTITFNAPPGPITSYTVYVNGSTGTGSGTAASYTITGLTSGTLYSITLTATNVRGTSAQSSALSVTPHA